MKKLIGLANLGTAGAAAILAMSLNAAPAAAQEATLYKNPQCGCCESYADYLRENGFTVEVKPTHDLAQISREAGIPDDFQGCHTAFLDDYVVSGHVPIDVVTSRKKVVDVGKFYNTERLRPKYTRFEGAPVFMTAACESLRLPALESRVRQRGGRCPYLTLQHGLTSIL